MLGKAKDNALAFEAPAIIPPIPPAMHTAIIGFFLGRFTPNIAGSVIPNSADKTAEAHTERNAPFLLFSITANAAPACANTAGPISARIVSWPLTVILFIAIKIKLQWNPKITIG